MSENRHGIASRLAGQSGLVMLGNLFTLLVGIPFQIYLARTLGTEQFGAFGLLETIAQTAVSLFAFGFGITLVRFIPQQIIHGQNQHIRALLTTVYLVTLVAGASAALLVMFGSHYLTDWMPELHAYTHLFPIVGAITFLSMLTGLSQQALRAFHDIRYMVLVSSFLQLTLKIVIAIVLLWWGWGLMGYLVAVVVSVGIAMAGMVWGLRGHIQRLGRTQEEVLPATRKIWWAYSRTMYANTLLGIAGAPIERFLLAGMINLASVGILMAVRQLQSLPQVLLQVIILVIAPMFVAAKARNDMDEVKHLYHIATDWVCRLGFPLLVFLLVFGDKVLGLYGETFADMGYWPLRIFVIGQFVNLLTGPVGNMLNMLGHENKLFRLIIISSAMSYLCLLVFVPIFGLTGIALGSALSMIYLNFVALRLMNKELGIAWWSARYKRLLAPLMFSLILALFANAMSVVQGAWALIMALAAIYGAFILIYVMRGLSREDKEIYSMLRSRLGLVDAK